MRRLLLLFNSIICQPFRWARMDVFIEYKQVGKEFHHPAAPSRKESKEGVSKSSIGLKVKAGG